MARRHCSKAVGLTVVPQRAGGGDVTEPARLVDVLRRSCEWTLAETAARRYVSASPESADPWIALGRVLLDSGREEEARQVFEEAERRFPQDDRPAGWIVAALSRGRDFAAAEQKGREAARRFPHSHAIRISLGRLYADSSRPVEALTLFEEAAALAPGNSRALGWKATGLARLHRWTEAHACLDDAPRPLAEPVVLTSARGRVLLMEKRCDEAIACFEQVLSMDPHQVAAWLNLARALRLARRHESATARIEGAIDLFPKVPALLVERGWTSSHQYRDADAVVWAERALALDPRHSWALRSRVDFLIWGRRFGEAERAAAEAAELRPDDPDVHVTGAWVFSSQDREDEAVVWAERALALDPRHSWALRSRIDFLRWQRRFDEAERAAAEAAELRPDDPDVHVTGAWVLSDQDRYDEALSRAERALAIDPRHRSALQSRIDFLRRQRRFGEAERAAAEAAELRPDEPDVHVTGAWLFSDQGREDEAVVWAERALALDPRHSWALRSRIDFLRQRRRFGEAERAAAEAAELRPDDPDVHVTGAWVFSNQDREDEAVVWADRALALDPRDSWALRSRIDFLRWARRFGEAERAAAEAAELRPDDPDVHVTGAWVFNDQDREDEAVVWAERALALDPRHTLALRSRIDFLRQRRRFGEAERAAAEAVALRPDHPGLLMAGAWVFSDQDREDEAVVWAERALALDPRDPWALRSRIDFLRWGRRPGEAEQAAAEALELRPDDPDLHVRSAYLANAQDLHDEAFSRLGRALALDPRHSWALRSRIDFLRRQRRFGEAERAAADAAELRPDDPDVHVTGAWVFSDQDREDEAVVWAERALALDPRHSAALRSRIDFLRQRRRFGEAERAAAEAAELRPDDPDVHVTGAWVFSDQDREDEAVVWAERALALDPRDSWALRSRIHFLTWDGRLGEAERALAEAVALRPDDPDLLVTGAWVFSNQDREDEAVVWAERALALDPRDPWALRSRIDFLGWGRRFAEAERALTEAVRLRPDDPDIYVSGAHAFSDQDRHDEALALVERALAISPRYSRALQSRIGFLRWGRRFGEAERAAAEALKLRPDDPDLHMTSAQVCSDQDRFEEALAFADRALEIDPRHSLALQSRIDHLRWEKRFEQAEQAAAEALTRRPGDAGVHVAVGRLRLDQLQDAAALTSFRKALECDPYNSEALEWHIWVLRRLRRFDDAAQAASAALRRRPGNLDIQLERACLHDDQRAFEAALTCFATVLDRDPGHVKAHTGRSAVLRTLRRAREAEREILRALTLRPGNRALKAELAWIHHDERRFLDARRGFQELLASAVNSRERAEAQHGLGWVAFAEAGYVRAAEHFRAAVDSRADQDEYELGLAWALVRQDRRPAWQEAEDLVFEILRRRPQEPAAHVCLGILAHKYGSLASAESHLKAALEIDPHYGSRTDLGALYVQMARYEEAETQLRAAVERDRYDTAAHTELGNLFLQLGDDRLLDAEREFRQALAVEAGSGAATIGLAQTLARAGNDNEAEAVLREALACQELREKWRTHLALARLLVQKGDKQQNPDLHAEAYAEAQRSVGLAPDRQADPHFVAGVAQHKMGSLAIEARGRFAYRRRARHHLRECLKRDQGHVEAQRSLQILEREMKMAAPALWGGMAVATLSFVLLATTWVMFFVSDKVTPVMVSVTTPVLVGLFTVSMLLPALIRLKLPGFEADLQAGDSLISPGPTGDVTFGPGRFTVAVGPMGQLPRRRIVEKTPSA
ncbi:tetratricopeptide repeat protein [Actinomadura sp. ATCC 31491]|uniref:Tetratricopeptide repeat protein n=1 Tax=Actinomadura luzonensis TaxID=2805427 RepID=A0ABT0G3W8_9ACTN|nr:tetratricopeptide repeat protein [Actinomadura luzonensis]MCK2219262.1 tetratricopeptide repeat protein [Actinomadura luzonensis]